ncbi:uncharacterized protein SPSK_01968 [Sporothrix schenckii 1099-18]|uniref:Uncharacterized protein n=1 Tax=Sporothrix schenckii 1099-18 TaxID=1397361 RepID=A0A0F2MDR3_SPOSC|nr:uncharacterized protein SPSK_01968 [Sporothrix schenckii 1099-18]KJR86970.1 hypothetical protein SPSK_01968 [Sporothrix schenckii 1099-18]
MANPQCMERVSVHSEGANTGKGARRAAQFRCFAADRGRRRRSAAGLDEKRVRTRVAFALLSPVAVLPEKGCRRMRLREGVSRRMPWPNRSCLELSPASGTTSLDTKPQDLETTPKIGTGGNNREPSISGRPLSGGAVVFNGAARGSRQIRSSPYDTREYLKVPLADGVRSEI